MGGGLHRHGARSLLRLPTGGGFGRNQRFVQGGGPRHRQALPGGGHRAFHGRIRLQFLQHDRERREDHAVQPRARSHPGRYRYHEKRAHAHAARGPGRYASQVHLHLRMAHRQHRHRRVLLRRSGGHDARVAAKDHGRRAAADEPRPRRRAAHRRRVGDGRAGHGLRAGLAPGFRVGTLLLPRLGDAGAGARRALRPARHTGGRGHDADLSGACLA